MSDPVWFWQGIVSPHMAGLAAALAARGTDVTYVAGEGMSAQRATQGWQPPPLGSASLHIAPTPQAAGALVQAAPANSVHICQGLRGNGLVDHARKALTARGLRQWVIMETVQDRGWRGAARRLAYARLVRQQRAHIEGILAIGHETPRWLAARGMTPERIVPFAYFLPSAPEAAVPERVKADAFRFLFAGQFIARKRLDLLVEALASLASQTATLTVIGSGPLEAELKSLAEARLPGRVDWLGRQPIAAMPGHMAQADCLVLPSRHDGFGAVVSEALMAGTPVICSDACGAAGIARASGHGAVFASGDVTALRRALERMLASGPTGAQKRARLAQWAACLGAPSGAEYLEAILSAGTRPAPPWAASPGGQP
jgi:glycosyltransferase involved in cell wall biosynthesis